MMGTLFIFSIASLGVRCKKPVLRNGFGMKGGGMGASVWQQVSPDIEVWIGKGGGKVPL